MVKQEPHGSMQSMGVIASRWPPALGRTPSTGGTMRSLNQCAFAVTNCDLKMGGPIVCRPAPEQLEITNCDLKRAESITLSRRP
jgi:hypothetical protein